MKNIIKNKKGYMLVEIIIASVIALVMAYFLIDVTVKLVKKNNDYYIDSVLIADKTIITKEIMDDINHKKLVKVEELSGNEFILYYDDSSSKKLTIDSSNSMIIYGDYSKKVSEELNMTGITLSKTNNILTISLDMYTNYSNEDYGIKIDVPYIEDIEIVYADLPKTFDEIKDRFSCKKTTDFDNASKTDEGLCETEDNLGTSYYFRGDIDYNYVKFAGFYWRIVRINGDGSIRIIYDGTSPHLNGEVSADRQLDETTSFNSLPVDTYLIGMGYMNYWYEVFDGYYNTTRHINTNNSNLKFEIDAWYVENIESLGYDVYVMDAIYCNDRGQTRAAIGRQTNVYDRVIGSGRNPTLICSSENDQFTVDEELGNGDLTYPVGTITADEVLFAGSGFNENKQFYLYTGYDYFTMSPAGVYYQYETDFSRCIVPQLARIFYVSSSGKISSYKDYKGCIGDNFYPRPVISLRADLKFTGSGTKDDPFVIFE